MAPARGLDRPDAGRRPARRQMCAAEGRGRTAP